VPTEPPDLDRPRNLPGGIVSLDRDELFTTVVVRELTFKQPVRVGDLLTLSGEVVASGTTSVTVRIHAETQR
jgi:acyl dehydratase